MPSNFPKSQAHLLAGELLMGVLLLLRLVLTCSKNATVQFHLFVSHVAAISAQCRCNKDLLDFQHSVQCDNEKASIFIRRHVPLYSALPAEIQAADCMLLH